MHSGKNIKTSRTVSSAARPKTKPAPSLRVLPKVGRTQRPASKARASAAVAPAATAPARPRKSRAVAQPVLRSVTKPSKDVSGKEAPGVKEAPGKDLAAALLVAVRLTQRLGLGELVAHELEFVNKVLAGRSCWLSEVNLERSPLLFACAYAALNQACVL